MFTEMASLHPSSYFHIGGDETYLLGHCDDCKAKAESVGKSSLYVEHIKMLCDIVIKLGKKPVLWADIALKHPEALGDLPEGTIFIDWNYGWKLNHFGDVEKLGSSGFEVWGAPSLRSSPDNYFLTCFECAKEIYESTNGAFDITVAPIVNAWGFGFTEAVEVDSSLIDSLLQYLGMDSVGIVEGKIWKEKDGIMLDMNAIAQGYAVDVLCEFLESKGIINYLVEIGGEIKTRGHNPRGTEWKVGIDRPIEGLQIPGVDLQAIVEISDRSLATSGNYRKFYEKDGVKYSHTIDPKTGYPVQHCLLSATVLAGDCMRADAYATGFMVMGYEKSR